MPLKTYYVSVIKYRHPFNIIKHMQKALNEGMEIIGSPVFAEGFWYLWLKSGNEPEKIITEVEI